MSDPRNDPAYMEYHAKVIAAVKANFVRRFGQPKTVAEQEQFDHNVRFFDEQCDYVDDFSEGNDPDDVADENIISADWS
jgi:hypothetical protein